MLLEHSVKLKMLSIFLQNPRTPIQEKMEAVMTCNMPKRWNPKMPKGLDLEFTHHPISMRRVVNIIIALERLKARSSESVLGTEFRDENLLNLIFENIVEGNYTHHHVFNHLFQTYVILTVLTALAFRKNEINVGIYVNSIKINLNTAAAVFKLNQQFTLSCWPVFCLQISELR